MEIKYCIDRCEELIAKGSSSFYDAFRRLPSPRKEAVFVIYAFCRLIDDSIDEQQPEMSIEEIIYSFDRLDTAEGHFIWPSLRWLFANFPISKASFYRQIEGQQRDLIFTHYETMEQLEQYCYLVAGTVGEMLLPVLNDKPSDRLVESGIYLGKAMQIVNIVRDVGEDRGRNRRYLPLDLMHKHGYSEQDFSAAVTNDAFRSLINELEQLARSWFEIGLRDIEYYPKKSAFTVELAASYYSYILDEVKNNNYQVFTKRAYVSDLRKKVMLASLVSKYATFKQAITYDEDLSLERSAIK